MLSVKKVNTTAVMLAPRVIQNVLDVPILAVNVTLKLSLALESMFENLKSSRQLARRTPS